MHALLALLVGMMILLIGTVALLCLALALEEGDHRVPSWLERLARRLNG